MKAARHILKSGNAYHYQKDGNGGFTGKRVYNYKIVEATPEQLEAYKDIMGDMFIETEDGQPIFWSTGVDYGDEITIVFKNRIEDNSLYTAVDDSEYQRLVSEATRAGVNVADEYRKRLGLPVLGASATSTSTAKPRIAGKRSGIESFND